MKGGFWDYLSGQVLFEAEGGRGTAFLEQCVRQGIAFHQITATPAGFRAQVPARDYPRLRRAARRYRCRIRLRERFGLRFACAWLRGRWGLAAGLAAALLMLTAFPHVIWNIEFYQFTPQEQLDMRAELYSCGIYEGAFTSPQEIARIATTMLAGTDDYSWIALNFVKGRLVVEKNNMEKKPALLHEEITDLVAVSDGIIRYMDVRGGYYQVQQNQSVSEGQLLVSGMITDDTVQKTVYTRSEGEIYAEVEKTYQYTQPLRVSAEVPQSGTQDYCRLLAFGMELPLSLGHPETDGVRRTVYREPVAPFGFHLPGTLECTRVRPMEHVETVLSPELAGDLAQMRIFEAVRETFGDIELLEQERSDDVTAEEVTVSLRLRFIANIAKSVPFGGLT